LLQGIAQTSAPGREDLELEDLEAVRRYILDLKPRIVVNAAAFTAVDAAESEVDRVFTINARAPRVIAKALRQVGGTLIQISTDYVFSGTRRSPYTEHHRAQPLCVYGASKLAGEVEIRNSGVSHLTLRTGWLMSGTHRGFADLVLSNVMHGDSIRLVSQWGAPTSATWLAATCARMVKCVLEPALDQGRMERAAHAGTTLHATASGCVDRHGLVMSILKVATQHGFRNVGIPAIEYVRSDFFGAMRPVYSVLDTSKLAALTGEPPPHWTATIEEIVPAAMRRLGVAGY